MKSIRRTLIISFALLFTGGLLVVAFMLDRIASYNLEDRAKVSADSIEKEFQERCREERDKLDQQLLNDARTLASQMQSVYMSRFDQESRKFRVAFAIADHFATLDPYTKMAWDAGNVRWAVYFSTARSYFTNLHLDDSFGQTEGDPDSSHEPHPRLFQINVASRTDSIWKSKTLGDAKFPHDPAGFDPPDKLVEWKYDDLTINGELVRRVVFRSPILLPWVPPTGGPPRAGGRGRGGRGEGDRDRLPQTPPPPMQRNAPPPNPAQLLAGLPRIYAHSARPVAVLEQPIAEHRGQRDEQLTQLAQVIDAARFNLRMTVVAIGATALAAILFGGLWLVRRGLTPLDRLSEAVGRVSERDFRLPVAKSELTTELIPIHARLTETLDQLKSAFEREKQAVADISHELRTPVAALLTTLDVALRKPRSADSYRETLEECRGITRQLGQLVERVMTLAYLDAGQARVSRVRVPAVELAAGCAAVIRPLAEARGLRFTLHADPAVEVDTDRDKFREVLMNLLHNAVEYNNPGGTIELAVHKNGGGRIAFDVRDSGIGMPDEVRGKIFERFYRADPSRTETGVHAGLGLAIVKEYIERLGGTITVESAPGKGSLFRVEIPAAKDEVEPPKLAT
jgi:signal transduction histidine kinase